MTDRFVVVTSRGEPCIRTNNKREADEWAERYRMTVQDRQEQG